MGLFSNRSNNKTLSALKGIKGEIEELKQELAGLSTNLANHVEEISLKELKESLLNHLDGLKEGKELIVEVQDSMNDIFNKNEGADECEEQRSGVANNIEAYNAIVEIGINNLGLYLNNFERLIESTNGINKLNKNVSVLNNELINMVKKIETTEIKLGQFYDKKESGI